MFINENTVSKTGAFTGLMPEPPEVKNYINDLYTAAIINQMADEPETTGISAMMTLLDRAYTDRPDKPKHRFISEEVFSNASSLCSAFVKTPFYILLYTETTLSTQNSKGCS